jgi:phosphatidylethanolamine-binding protein (PEBP) family uncharacterized protein
MTMKLSSRSFADGQRIPAEFAFGKPGADSPCILSDNRNPQLAWSGAPAGTRSFVLMCIDSDVPTRGDDVNQPGRTVPHDLPRTDFVHWLMIDIPRECGELAAGSCSDGIVARGKRDPAGPPGSRQGVNDYTGWFAGNAEMAGSYFGYDGPFPPFNDSLVHHYVFTLYALDCARAPLEGAFGGADARRAIYPHVLGSATFSGTYTLNRRLLQANA